MRKRPQSRRRSPRHREPGARDPRDHQPPRVGLGADPAGTLWRGVHRGLGHRPGQPVDRRPQGPVQWGRRPPMSTVTDLHPNHVAQEFRCSARKPCRTAWRLERSVALVQPTEDRRYHRGNRAPLRRKRQIVSSGAAAIGTTGVVYFLAGSSWMRIFRKRTCSGLLPRMPWT